MSELGASGPMVRRAIREQNRAEFKTLDRRELAKMDDKALAQWQSDYKSDEPQWRLAEYEWQRRITAEQINATMRSARWQAWFGVFAALIGGVLGALLAILVQNSSK
jgi:hypothetical protein